MSLRPQQTLAMPLALRQLPVQRSVGTVRPLARRYSAPRPTLAAFRNWATMTWTMPLRCRAMARACDEAVRCHLHKQG
jgi:hypothetical protein